MADFGRDEWEDDSQGYTENQVHAVLSYVGIETVTESAHDFLCYCPYHGNRDTPAFSVSKRSGEFWCFNPSCGVGGTLDEMIRQLKGLTPFEALRVIAKKGSETTLSYDDRVANLRKNKTTEFPVFPQNKLDQMYESFWTHTGPQQYMMGERKFEGATLRHFRVGYSPLWNMVTVPMHTPNGNPTGLIGRSLEGKVFKNSVNLPKSLTMWNLHRARAHETVVVTESSFDAMRVHQAGYPNVVAMLGGYATTQHFELFNRYFTRLIIMTDNDEFLQYPNCRKCKRHKRHGCAGHSPGRELGGMLVEGLRNLRVMWAAYDEGVIYPHNAKDAGDLTDDEIRRCLSGAVNNFEYQQWNRLTLSA